MAERTACANRIYSPATPNVALTTDARKLPSSLRLLIAAAFNVCSRVSNRYRNNKDRDEIVCYLSPALSSRSSLFILIRTRSATRT